MQHLLSQLPLSPPQLSPLQLSPLQLSQLLSPPLLGPPLLVPALGLLLAPFLGPSLSPSLGPLLVAATVGALLGGPTVPTTIPTAQARIAPSRGSLSVARGYTWPLSPRPAVHRRFEPALTRWSAGHRGVDLVSDVGQPVLSAGNGVVAFSGVVAGRGVVTVRHTGGLRTTYEPVDQRLTSGTAVHRGTRIGVLSATPGHCAPLTCLHWGAIVGHSYRDPLSLLSSGRPILLPLQ